MRHSKAEPAGETDFERELTPRGRSDAVAAGAWLASQAVVPDRALVSAATRAQQTWEAVAEGAGWALEPTIDAGLYTADPDTTLDVLRTLGDDCPNVLVIGHNPSMASLAQLIDDGEWADLGPGTASVTAFHVGRG